MVKPKVYPRHPRPLIRDGEGLDHQLGLIHWEDQTGADRGSAVSPHLPFMWGVSGEDLLHYRLGKMAWFPRLAAYLLRCVIPCGGGEGLSWLEVVQKRMDGFRHPTLRGEGEKGHPLCRERPGHTLAVEIPAGLLIQPDCRHRPAHEFLHPHLVTFKLEGGVTAGDVFYQRQGFSVWHTGLALGGDDAIVGYPAGSDS